MPDNLSPSPLNAQPHGGNRVIARQAILDEKRTVFGYELFDRSMQSSEHTAASDAQLLFNALSLAEYDSLASRKTIFVNCTHESLAAGHLDLVEPEHVVLEIPPLPLSQIDQIGNHLPNLQQMQRRGFRLAFDYSVLTKSYESWLPLASFIKFDLSVLKAEAIAGFVKLAQAKSTARLIAEKVETHKQYAMVEGLDVKLFQGFWFAKPVIVEGQSVRPSQANILRLIDLVRKQASTDEIETVLKHDPMLSFNLLRFINSAGFGMRTEVTSFKHAVMLLGLNRLFKWAALLMTTSLGGDTPPAVGTTAVVRGRLMELLALQKLPPEESDNAFVAGVFSLLDTMLGMPMDKALASLTLPQQVVDALLHQTGPLAPFLALTLACESSDDTAFASATKALGMTSSEVNLAHLEALAWAETLSI
ncbi:HDOD domain-containing protein [Rhodoferax sp. GW822-FHT02A01]|uniref:EAL and HDOD domain-containing protein n=1 Tax=Rhodoferax sp. GW822-FHT02A01 TaxID=3141537 RepID=UPI00315C9AE1